MSTAAPQCPVLVERGLPQRRAPESTTACAAHLGMFCAARSVGEDGRGGDGSRGAGASLPPGPTPLCLYCEPWAQAFGFGTRGAWSWHHQVPAGVGGHCRLSLSACLCGSAGHPYPRSPEGSPVTLAGRLPSELQFEGRVSPPRVWQACGKAAPSTCVGCRIPAARYLLGAGQCPSVFLCFAPQVHPFFPAAFLSEEGRWGQALPRSAPGFRQAPQVLGIRPIGGAVGGQELSWLSSTLPDRSCQGQALVPRR